VDVRQIEWVAECYQGCSSVYRAERVLVLIAHLRRDGDHN
jgi:hypothetical protein